MATTDLAPIGLQATPDGMTPCAVCGVPATGPTTAYPILLRTVRTAIGERADALPDGASVDLPTCGDCRALDALAARIIAAHPGLTRALGTVASWRLRAALYALDATGQKLPSPDVDPARLGSLVHRLAVPGALATYSRRYSPAWLADATTKHSARSRWSAVHPHVLGDCRRGYVDWLADARPPRPITHPTRRRCDWCGTSTAMGRRLSEAWNGDLCGTCAAVQDSGGTSHDAVWQAIDARQTMRRHLPYRPDLNGVRPWSRGGGGDGTPWSHLGGVDAVRQRVAELIAAG